MAKYVGFKIGKVHESHVISEYYCGGCGWPVTDHDSFCPECGGAFRECDASNLEAENAKLRKLADAVKEFVEDIHCEDCPCRRDCDDNNVFFCVDDLSYHAFAAMRELGMDLDG